MIVFDLHSHLLFISEKYSSSTGMDLSISILRFWLLWENTAVLTGFSQPTTFFLNMSLSHSPILQEHPPPSVTLFSVSFPWFNPSILPTMFFKQHLELLLIWNSQFLWKRVGLTTQSPTRLHFSSPWCPYLYLQRLFFKTHSLASELGGWAG